MLEEIGTPYEAVMVEYGPKMKSAEYLAINPMGKVPALRHGDKIITECAAICTYLAHTFPEAGLVPNDRSAFYRWMFFAAGPLEHASTNVRMGWIVSDEHKGHTGYGSFEDVLRVLNQRLAEAPYFCGDTFSAVDVYIGSQIGFGIQFGTLPVNDTLLAYWDRIKDRPARLRATQIDDALIPSNLAAPH